MKCPPRIVLRFDPSRTDFGVCVDCQHPLKPDEDGYIYCRFCYSQLSAELASEKQTAPDLSSEPKSE